MLASQPADACKALAKWPDLRRGEQGPRTKMTVPEFLYTAANEISGLCFGPDAKERCPQRDVRFSKNTDGRTFAILTCDGLHSDVSFVFEEYLGSARIHRFASTYGGGFFSKNYLANVEIDAATGEITEYERASSCDEGSSNDFSRSYKLIEDNFVLYKVETKNCKGSPWKVYWKLK
jgi:hypothetical protein